MASRYSSGFFTKNARHPSQTMPVSKASSSSSSYSRRRDIDFYKAFCKFYTEELMPILKAAKRNSLYCKLLLLIRFVEKMALLLSAASFTSVLSLEPYFNSIEEYNFSSVLNKYESSFTQHLVYAMTALNAMLIIYLIVKFFMFIINDRKALKLSTISSQIQQNKSAAASTRQITTLKPRFLINEIVTSCVFQTYNYAILIPSLMASSVDVNGSSSTINIILTFILCIIIANNDYDYTISSADGLRMKYYDVSVLFCLFEALGYFLTSLVDSSLSILLLFFVECAEIAKIVLFQPYFDRKMQTIQLQLNLYVAFLAMTVFTFLQIDSMQIHTLSLFTLIYFPLAYKIGTLIETLMIEHKFRQFQKYNQLNTDNSLEGIDFLMRSILLNNSLQDTQNTTANQNIQAKRAVSYQDHHKEIFITNLLISKYQSSEDSSAKNASHAAVVSAVAAALTQQTGTNKKLQGNNNNTATAVQSPEMTSFGTRETVKNGKQYILKEQVFGDHLQFKAGLHSVFDELLQSKRDPKQFQMADIIYLAFLIEIRKNYSFFELSTHSQAKSIGLKKRQILSTLISEVQKQKAILKSFSDKQSIFDTSYQEALEYDELILSTQKNMYHAVQKKLLLLRIMRQRTIDLDELQGHCEEMLDMRSNLIADIQLMIRVNEMNGVLYEIYLNYLEALAFSESDIKLEQPNRYANKQRELYHDMNTIDSCVVFASLKSDLHTIKITKHSMNAERFFNITKAEDRLVDRNIEQLMPQVYARHHKYYIQRFFAKGENESKIFNQLLFGISATGHLIPLRIDLKVNLFARTNEFGISTLFKKTNKEKQYLLFDAHSARLQSMTQGLHMFIFAQFSNFTRVNILPYFPFLVNFKEFYGYSINNSSMAQQTVFPLSGKNSQSSLRAKQIFSNQSLPTAGGRIQILNNNSNSSNGQQQQRVFKNALNVKQTIDLDGEFSHADDPQKSLQVSKKKAKEIIARNQMKKNDKKFNNAQDSFDGCSFEEFHRYQYDESDERRYQNINYMLIIANPAATAFSAAQSLNVKTKKPTTVSASDFVYFSMTLSVFSVKTAGMENVKYFEIWNIKQLSLQHNAKFILSVCLDEDDTYLSNAIALNPNELAAMIDDMAAISAKDSVRLNSKNIGDNIHPSNSNRLLLDVSANEAIDSHDAMLHSVVDQHNNDHIIMYNRQGSSNSGDIYAHKHKQYSQQQQQQLSVLKEEENEDAHHQAIRSNQRKKSFAQQNEATRQHHLSTSFFGTFVSGNDTTAQHLLRKEIGGIPTGTFEQTSTAEMNEHSKMFFDDKSQLEQQLNHQGSLNKLVGIPTGIDTSGEQHPSQSHHQMHSLLSPTDMHQPQKNSNNIASQLHNINLSAFPFFARLQSFHKEKLDSPQQQQLQQEQPNTSAAPYKKSPSATKNVYETSWSNHINHNRSTDVLSPNHATDQSSQNNLMFHRGMSATAALFSPTQQQQMGISTATRLRLQHDTSQRANIESSHNFLSVKREQMSQQQQLQGGFIDEEDQKQNASSKSMNKTQTQTVGDKNQHKQKKLNEVKNLKEALDSSSNHSRESSSSSTRKATKRIILQKSTLFAMRMINLIGLLSFTAIIVVVLDEYFVTNSDLDVFSADLQLTNWSTAYSSDLSIIKKDNYLILLINAGYLGISSSQTATAISLAQTEMYAAFNAIKVLLDAFSIASDQRQMVNTVLSTEYVFEYGAAVDHDAATLTGQVSNSVLYLVPLTDSLYIATTNLFAYLFNYVYEIDGGASKFIVLNNTDSIITSLNEITAEVNVESVSSLNSIDTSLTNILLIITLVTGACIVIIMPLYAYIQQRREEIIILFATFHLTVLDQITEQIVQGTVNLRADQSSMKNTKIQSKANNNTALVGETDNQKRQNLSSTTKLQRFSVPLCIGTVIIYILTLPYPILNKVLSSSYLSQSTINLTALEALYEVQAFVIEESSSFFEGIALKYDIDTSNTLAFDDFYATLTALVSKASSIQKTFEDAVDEQKQSSMYNQDVFDAYFLAMFEGNICEILFTRQQYIKSSTTLTSTQCSSLSSGILTKGLTIAIQDYVEIYHDLYEILDFDDLTEFETRFQKFLATNDVYTLVLKQIYISSTIEALTAYLREENSDYLSFLQTILLILLIYQFLVLALVFYFAWIPFYQIMDNLMHRTKQYLVTLHVTNLVANPFVQNYLHNTLR